LAELGYLALLLALGLCLYGIVTQIVSLKAQSTPLNVSSNQAVLAVAGLNTVASLSLIYLLMSGDFSVAYVYQYTSSDLPGFYKFAAFWAGNAGSLLLWSWALSIYTALVVYRNRQPAAAPYIKLVLLVNNLFFLFLLSFVTSPFELLPTPLAPLEGAGLNPLLQNPGMVIHPVTLYLGYVGLAIPFAYAMGALFTRSTDDSWIKETRRWTLVAWLFLSLGNLYGGMWAYQELGWGGYWAWDPVENASFMPWLTGTAFIHSVIMQERRGILKTWNMVLVSVTYFLTLFGTYLTRSGVLTSVHAFGDDLLGRYFLAFLLLVMAFSVYLITSRASILKEERQIESYLSRESSFLANNLLLVGSAFAVFWGTMYPLISELIGGTRVTVGAPFFDTVVGSILLGMIFLMGVCMLISWQRSSRANLRRNFLVPFSGAIVFGAVLWFWQPFPKPLSVVGMSTVFFVLLTIILEFGRGTLARRRLTGENYFKAFFNLIAKNRRRYGGYLVHLGIVIMAFGIIASHGYAQETTVSLAPGQTASLGDYTVTYNGLKERPEGANAVVFADLTLAQGDRELEPIHPEKIFYANWDEPSTEPAIRGTWQEDFYVILSGWRESGAEATFKLFINPLMQWIWFGGYLLVFGTLIALWPRGREISPRY